MRNRKEGGLRLNSRSEYAASNIKNLDSFCAGLSYIHL